MRLIKIAVSLNALFVSLFGLVLFMANTSNEKGMDEIGPQTGMVVMFPILVWHFIVLIVSYIETQAKDFLPEGQVVSTVKQTKTGKRLLIWTSLPWVGLSLLFLLMWCYYH